VHGVLVAAVAVAMVVGLAGTVVPVVPGLLLVWGAGVVYGLVEGFGVVGWVSLGLMSGLAVAGTVAGVVLPKRSGAASGASRSALVAGATLGVVGFFAVPVVGLPLGAVAGVLLAERARTGAWGPAWVATRGVVVGFGLGALAQLAAGTAMIACWAIWVVAG
jgi:uncharacterized protein YqgC (DUF456 family)